MYEVIIKTPYNTVMFSTDDIGDDEVREILDQPWAEDVEIRKVESTNFKKLIRRKDEESR